MTHPPKQQEGMRVTVELEVTPWTTPSNVIFGEGLKMPVEDADKEIIKHLCRRWLDEICTKSGMTFEVVFDMFPTNLGEDKS